jgi:sigma-E factor negative regulatory protein RseA
MNDEREEGVSALMDGELADGLEAELIDDVIASRKLRTRWERYHLVRDVLRERSHLQAGTRLYARVRESLRDEPLHFSAREAARVRWRAALAPLAGVALAASVAAVAILGVRSVDPGPGPGEPIAVQSDPGSLQAGALGTPLASDGGAPDSVPSTTTRPRARTAALDGLQWNNARPGVEDRLNGYLVTHSEYLGNGMRGMHPYARIVGYDATDQR